MPKRPFLTSLLVTSVLSASPAFAGGESHHDSHTGVIAGIFIGMTDTDYEENFTVGAEVEWRFAEAFGVGIVVEHAPDAHHGDGATLALATANVHPYKGLRLSAGIGQEWIDGHEEQVNRLAAAYEFTHGSYVIAPTFAVDFINDHESYVYGVTFGRHF